MSSADKQEFDDQILVRYLLGSLPEEEAERLDELSIRDDAIAWRLNAVENDLVDAYVRGELSAENLVHFERSYSSSPKRLQKMEFAEALRTLDGKQAAAAADVTPDRAVATCKPRKESSKSWSSGGWFSVPSLALQWGFASGTIVMLFTASYLYTENTRLRRQTVEEQGSHAALDHREQELQRQLKDQLATNAENKKELDGFRTEQPNLDKIRTVSALLLPSTRGTGRLSTLSVPPGTHLVVLLLTLESDDFPAYGVALKASEANQVVWHSTNLETVSSGTMKMVSVSFPAHLLKQQNYVLELSGVPSNGSAEFISGYPIRVVIVIR